jgi:hypothetical protein
MAEDMLPCHIRIDKEGRWYYQDVPIINRKIYLYLNQCLTKDSSGRYILLMDGEQCCLEVEDTPFVVREAGLSTLPGRKPGFFVKLNDETEEALKVATLRVGQDDVLYCRVKEEQYEARFLRASYYQLADFLQHDGKRYYLLVEGEKIYLKNL